MIKKLFIFVSLILLLQCYTPNVVTAQMLDDVTLTGEADSADLEMISKIRGEIEQVELDMDVEALRKLKRHFADDVAMMPGHRVVRGPDAIIEFHENLYTRFDAFDVRFIIDSIHVMGGLAIEKGRTKGMVYPTNSPPKKNSGPYLYVYERDENGQWKIVRFSW